MYVCIIKLVLLIVLLYHRLHFSYDVTVLALTVCKGDHECSGNLDGIYYCDKSTSVDGTGVCKGNIIFGKWN